MALVENKHYHLEELAGSDYEIVDDEPNIIGWKVKTEDGILIGEVDNLLFDRYSRKVRYLVLDLDRNKLELDDDRKVLIPIGIAEIFTKRGDRPKSERRDKIDGYYPEEDGNIVILPEVTAEHLDALPLYEKDHLSPHVETAISNIFARRNHAEPPRYEDDDDKEEFYRQEHFNETKFYRRKKDDDQ